VLGELDAEALVGAGVQAGHRAFDHTARHQREVLDAGQGLGLQVFIAAARAHRSLRLLRSPQHIEEEVNSE